MSVGCKMGWLFMAPIIQLTLLHPDNLLYKKYGGKTFREILIRKYKKNTICVHNLLGQTAFHSLNNNQVENDGISVFFKLNMNLRSSQQHIY